MTESRRCPVKTRTDAELFLKNEQGKEFFEMESTSGEDARKTVEMTRKDLGCT